MRNDPAAPSTSRTPRGAVLLNGEEVAGWLSCETEENAFYHADTFSITFVVADLPPSRGPAWWATVDEIEVEIRQGLVREGAAVDAASLESVFVGKVDGLAWSVEAGTITVNGRDLTAPMIDTKTTEKYVNRTASDVVEEIAAKHGLKVEAQRTSEKVGRYYQIDRVRLQASATEWDLLTRLAREEGFSVFVRARTLHFLPEAEDADPWVIRYRPPPATGGPPEANTGGLSFSRAMTMAKGVKVTVKSWNPKQKKGFTRTAGRAGEDGQEYLYTIPGLEPEEAQRRADKLLAEITAHEVVLSLAGPAETGLRIGDVIEVQGTGTAFDQRYYPDSIRRRLAPAGGYDWTVNAKNRRPESEPNL